MSKEPSKATGTRRGAFVALGLAMATGAACSRFRVEFEDSGQRADAPSEIVDAIDATPHDAMEVGDAADAADIVDATEVPSIDVVDVVAPDVVAVVDALDVADVLDVADIADVVAEEASAPPDAGPPPCAPGTLPTTVPTGVRTVSLSETINPGAGGTGLVYGAAGSIFATGRSTPGEVVGGTRFGPPSDVGAERSNYVVGVDPGASAVTWVQFFRNSVGEEGSGVAMGPASADQLVFATGAFRGTLTVGGMTLAAAPSRTEGYLARFTTNGSLRSLVAIPGSDGRDFFPVSISTGADGTVCIVANERARDTSAPANDTASRVVLRCVAPDDTATTYRFGRATDLLYAHRVAVTTDGELVVGGVFRGEVQFGAQTLRAAPGTPLLWLGRVTARGEARWARSLMVTGNHLVRGIASGCLGDAWVAFDYENPVTFAGRTYTNNITDTMVLRVAPDGSDRWAFSLSNRESDIVETVISDGAGNAVFGGSVNAGEATFPVPSGPTIYMDPRDVFLVGLDGSGGATWSRAWRVTRESGPFSFDTITGLAVHGATLAVMGQSFGGVPFGPSAVTHPGWFIAELR